LPELAILAVVVLAYTLVAARLDRFSISAPIVLVTAGALLGPAGLHAVEAPATSVPVQVLAELTLAILLFTDASTIGLREAGRIAWLPDRLLGIGLLLTILAGALVGWLFFPALGLGFALLLASILAPTDAALSLPLLLDRAIPVRVRRAINIESGLNDGIATPFVTLFLAVVIAEETTGEQHWLIVAGLEIAIALAVAAVVGGLGGWLVANARRHGWASLDSESLGLLAMALLAYAGATALDGNGFVAAFAAGVAFRTVTAGSEPSVEFAESVGVAASYVVWLVFGVALAGPVVAAGVDPVVLLYAILSLTVVRMGPVALALLGTGLRRDTVTLIGWFGPRGMASVVFLLIAFDQMGPAHAASETLFRVVTWTILLSVLAHGLSAGPVGSWYARRIATAGPDAWESGAAHEPRVRRRPIHARTAGETSPPT
jgi:NhaP-type Na+/H+ or K+/H+ antiporter